MSGTITNFFDKLLLSFLLRAVQTVGIPFENNVGKTWNRKSHNEKVRTRETHKQKLANQTTQTFQRKGTAMTRPRKKYSDVE